MHYVQPYMDKASTDLQSIVDSLQVSEAHFFDEDRYNEADIKKVLDLGDQDSEKKIVAMKQVLAAVSYGRDCGDLFPHVVKNVATQSLELKKLTYIYLVQYADCKPELALLSINSFQKDLTDRSQLIRASALRALSSVRTMEIIQIVVKSIRTALADSSAYVRKTATACIVRVYEVDRDLYIPLRDLAVKLLQDRNTSVVASAITTFHYLCVARRPTAEPEGTTLALLHPYFRRLLPLAASMDQWAQSYFTDIMLRYAKLFLFKPAEEESEAPPVSADFESLIQCLRSLLRAQSTSVVLSAGAALCYLSRGEDDVKAVIPALLRSVRIGSWDSMAVLFSGFLPILRTHPGLFRPYLSDFFVMQMDPNSIKLLKIEVLELLADEKNCSLILAELKQYVRWHTYGPLVARSIRAISNVALSVDSSVVDSCLRDLVKMLDSKCETVSSEAVVALRTLLQSTNDAEKSGEGGIGTLNKGQFWIQVISQLARSLTDLTSPVARASVVWILGEYQAEVPRPYAPDAVRRLAKSFGQEALDVKHQIITLAYKVWAYHLLTPGSCSTDNKAENTEALSTGSESAVLVSSGEGAMSSASSSSSSSNANGASTSDEQFRKTMVVRLEKMLDYICAQAQKDEESWDLRDMGRFVAALKDKAKAELGITEVDVVPSAPVLQKLKDSGIEGTSFAAAFLSILTKQPAAEALTKSLQGIKKKKPTAAVQTTAAKGELQSVLQNVQYRTAPQDLVTSYKDRKSWILYSLARILDGPFASYQSLPEFSELTPDAVRDPPVDQLRQLQKHNEPTSFSSQKTNGFEFAQAQKVQQPSMIDKAVVPKIETVFDLESFYAQEEKVTVRSAEMIMQQQKARQAISAQKKNPQFNRTVTEAPVEDLSTFSLLPDAGPIPSGLPPAVGVAPGGIVPGVMPPGMVMPGGGLNMPGVMPAAHMPGQQFVPGMQPAGALPAAALLPQGPQVIEGEDEESEDDDWDVIKKTRTNS